MGTILGLAWLNFAVAPMDLIVNFELPTSKAINLKPVIIEFVNLKACAAVPTKVHFGNFARSIAEIAYKMC